MRRYGYKTKREAYKNMDWCKAEEVRGEHMRSSRTSATSRNISEIFLMDRTVVISATDDAAWDRRGAESCSGSLRIAGLV